MTPGVLRKEHRHSIWYFEPSPIPFQCYIDSLKRKEFHESAVGGWYPAGAC